MRDIMKRNEPILKKLLKFDRIAMIVGFIVDMIAISSILFALEYPEMTNIPLPSFITPNLALLIWCVSTYVYLSYLQIYWDMNRIGERFHDNFFLFIWEDLILSFRSPFRLAPGLILAYFLWFILKSVDPSTYLPLKFVILVGIPILIVIWLVVKITVDADNSHRRRP